MGKFDAKLGVRIWSVRKAGGYTQQAIAERLELNRLAVGNIESGSRKLYMHEAVKLAKLFGMTVDDLINPPPDSDMDVFEFILWRLDYNATDMGELGKYVKWEYIVNFVNEARKKYGG